MVSFDRRTLLQAGIFGLAALSSSNVTAMAFARGFTHGVASGEPGPDSVLLWTRYVGSGETRLKCEIANDTAFANVVSGGELTATHAHDNCAKLTVAGLEPDRWYYYRFIAPNGDVSDIGRTRTLPVGDVSRFGIGLFSCSNMGFGYFNAYAHAARRSDLDLIVHVGDYMYEYPHGVYPTEPLAERRFEPLGETVSLADYRLRFASYRHDPDLRRLHQLFPMIAQWDDHELTNDAYIDGAQNHQLDTEGDWEVRKAAAKKAYREWMPVSDAPYNRFEIGNLASLFRLETRIEGRSQQLDMASAVRGQADMVRALGQFRDEAWSDPARSILGMAQEQWLHDGLAQSARSGTRWQILAQQIVMGEVKASTTMADFIAPDGNAALRANFARYAAAAKAGLPFNMDAWDGYPAARERLLRAALEANANLVVLAGDSHNAWGSNLICQGEAVGVEYAGHSVSSPGWEAYVPQLDPLDFANSFKQANPTLLHCETSRRGYVSLELTPETVTGTWHNTGPEQHRNAAVLSSHSLSVHANERHFAS